MKKMKDLHKHIVQLLLECVTLVLERVNLFVYMRLFNCILVLR